MFKRAIRDDKESTDRANRGRSDGERIARVIGDSPCVLRCVGLPHKDVLSPRSRTPGACTRIELVALIADERIPTIDRRVFSALQLLTGMRHDEAARLRWRNIDERARPLWSIDLRTRTTASR